MQRLVPRHIDQAQGHVALHAVGDDDVEVRHIRDQLQHRARRNVLEIEGDPAAVEDRLGILGQLVVNALGSDFDHVFIAGLVGELLERTLGRYLDTHTSSARTRLDVLHRRREIEHVQTFGLARRQLHVEDIQHNLVAFLLQVGSSAWAGEADKDAPFTIGAPAKIDIAQLDRIAGYGLGRIAAAGSCRSRCRSCHIGRDAENQLLAIDSGFVACGPEQVDHDARAPGGFHRGDARRGSCANLDATLAERISRVGQVERDSRRGFRGKCLRHGHRFSEPHRDFDPPSGLCSVGEILKHVLGLCRICEAETEQRDQTRDSGSPFPYGGLAPLEVSSCRSHFAYPQRVGHFLSVLANEIEACRSTQPPVRFGTSSTSSIWPSLIAVMRP